MAATPGSAAALRKIAETAARIFGNVLGTGERSGRKLLSKPLIGERIATYYPEDVARSDPLYEDPLEKRYAVWPPCWRRFSLSPPLAQAQGEAGALETPRQEPAQEGPGQAREQGQVSPPTS
jgi:small subunit ribosomal protein S33